MGRLRLAGGGILWVSVSFSAVLTAGLRVGEHDPDDLLSWEPAAAGEESKIGIYTQTPLQKLQRSEASHRLRTTGTMTLSFPASFEQNYDERCDSSLKTFVLHNKKALEEEGKIEFHSIASMIGLARACWILFKLLVAEVTRPSLPIEVPVSWRIANFASVVQRATALPLTAEERRRPQVAARVEYLQQTGHPLRRLSPGGTDAWELPKQGARSKEEELTWLELQCSAGKAAACGLTSFTGDARDLLLNRSNPADAASGRHSILLGTVLHRVEDEGLATQNLQELKNYIESKLQQPARALSTFNLPWNVRVQFTLFFVQLVGAAVELFSFLLSKNDSAKLWEPRWRPYLFRAEVFLPYMYMSERLRQAMRACSSIRPIARQARGRVAPAPVRLRKGGPWGFRDPLVWINTVLLLPIAAAFCMLVVALPVVLVVAVVCLPGYMVALVACCQPWKKQRSLWEEIVEVQAEMADKKLNSRQLWMSGSRLLFLPAALVANYVAQKYISPDTYFCTFSKFVLLPTDFRFFSYPADSVVLYVVSLACGLLLVAVLATLGLFTHIPEFLFESWLRHDSTVDAVELARYEEKADQSYLGAHEVREHWTKSARGGLSQSVEGFRVSLGGFYTDLDVVREWTHMSREDKATPPNQGWTRAVLDFIARRRQYARYEW